MPMRYSTFGRRTGLRVSEFALGTGNFGTVFAAAADLDEAPLILKAFAEAGGTLIDTADGYNHGQSETFVGDLVAGDRDHFVISSKYTSGARADPDMQRLGNGRKNMIRSVEDSLRRLRTDYLDIYWAHHPDSITPLDEMMLAFDHLVAAGKVLHVGLSNFPAWQVARSATLAELRGWAPLAGIQLEYSLVERSGDRELLPMANALGLGLTMWSPLGGGLLTGKYRRGETGRMGQPRRIHREDTPTKVATLDALIDVAAEIGAAPGQVALAWLRALGRRSGTPSIPIIGPRTVSQLGEQLGSLDVELDDAQFARLDQASAIALGAPYDGTEAAYRRLLGVAADRFVRP
jgi:aryl-alcohol dehydrogenase-like predicted oxidoreductase